MTYAKLPPKVLNFSEMKFVPMSETILLGMPYLENIILQAFIASSALNHSTCFTTGNLLWQSSIQR